MVCVPRFAMVFSCVQQGVDHPRHRRPHRLLRPIYSTTPESSAVQWLAKDLTAGGVHPYMFTQCEPIHARALLPCQDTPSAKFSYEASVTVPDWATAVMSALSKSNKRKAGGELLTFYFEQPVVIPAYLLAIAVGQLQSRDVGPRSRVWSEPSVVEAAAYEFEQAEEFITTAEGIMGHAYVWGRYDILCPPHLILGGHAHCTRPLRTATLHPHFPSRTRTLSKRPCTCRQVCHRRFHLVGWRTHASHS